MTARVWPTRQRQREYALWSKADGGVLETHFYSVKAAFRALVEYVADDPGNALDLRVIEVCDLHDDQPADDCGDCASAAGE